MSSLRFGLFVVIAAALTGALVACDASTGATRSGALITVRVRGGLCVGGPCDSVVILDHDGRVHAAAKPPNDLGLVPPAQMDTLEKLIAAADYGTIKSRSFTGECPTAFDGQEIVIEFSIAGGVQRIATCEVEVDWGHPLFAALSAALGPFIALPTT